MVEYLGTKLGGWLFRKCVIQEYKIDDIRFGFETERTTSTEIKVNGYVDTATVKVTYTYNDDRGHVIGILRAEVIRIESNVYVDVLEFSSI